MKPLSYHPIHAQPSNLMPLGDFVLVRPLPEEEKVGSIFLPENARDPERGLRRGVVVACGPGDKVPHQCERNALDCFGTTGPISEAQKELHRIGMKRTPMTVQPGNEIIFPRVPANVVNIGGEELVLIHEEQHVLAVLEKE